MCPTIDSLLYYCQHPPTANPGYATAVDNIVVQSFQRLADKDPARPEGSFHSHKGATSHRSTHGASLLRRRSVSPDRQR